MKIGSERGTAKKVMKIWEKIYSATNTRSYRGTWKTEPN